MVANHSLSVLAIEDDLDTQANLRDILELDGYRVASATTIREALDRNNWSEFSAILLDRRLPDGLSDELLPHLQRLAPDAAVVVITAYADVDGTIAALRGGASDFILKPLNPDMLRATLARIVRIKEAERRVAQSERLAAIGQMIAAITHESRNALQRSMAYLEELADLLRQRTDAMELVTGTRRAIQQLQRLLEEVRAFAAPLKLERSVCDLPRIWRQVWSDLEPSLRGRDAQLRDVNCGTDVRCDVDLFRVEQVFRNLFENALSARPDPVRIDIECHEATIDGSPSLSIIVRDYGPGFSDDQLQKAFEPFFTTKPQGTGLGLAIVKRIIDAHGGRIELANRTRGKDAASGAEVRILLPSRRSDNRDSGSET
jgi:signal transduction histidine kinase